MNEDFLIYTVSVAYKARFDKRSSVTVGYQTSVNVQGKEQRDSVLKHLTDKGFEPSWSLYHANGAETAKAIFDLKIGDFPPFTE